MAYNLQLVATHKQESISTVKNLEMKFPDWDITYYCISVYMNENVEQSF